MDIYGHKVETPLALANCLYKITQESLYVREGRQRKLAYRSPLASILEREETDCEEGTDPDGAECTTKRATGSLNVREVKGCGH